MDVCFCRRDVCECSWAIHTPPVSIVVITACSMHFYMLHRPCSSSCSTVNVQFLVC